jgi:hypothetical protein
VGVRDRQFKNNISDSNSSSLSCPGSLEEIRSTANKFLCIRPAKRLPLNPDAGPDVMAALGLLSDTRCQDRCGQIFGIHSLLTSDLRRGIFIDDSACACHVFASATRAIIERDGSLMSSQRRTQTLMMNSKTCHHGRSIGRGIIVLHSSVSLVIFRLAVVSILLKGSNSPEHLLA